MARLSFYLMLAFSCLCFVGAMDVEQGRANHMDLARRATTRKATPTHHKTTSKHKTTHKATAAKKSTKTKAAKAKATKKAKKTKTTKKVAKHKATTKQVKTTKTASKTSKASATAKSTTPLTLVSYANYSYASTPQEFYKLWRLKCIHIVGPRSMHHVIRLINTGAVGNQQAWVYCHGVPAVPGTDAKYSSKNPYSKTCPNGPQTDVTDEEIRKLGVKRVGALGTLVQAKGC